MRENKGQAGDALICFPQGETTDEVQAAPHALSVIDSAFVHGNSPAGSVVDAAAFHYESIMTVQKGPPWGTKGVINRVGAKLRAGERLNLEELVAFEQWRGGHAYVLNTFKPLLWRRVKGKDIIPAQRLKRRSTIIDKLSREAKMELARMDDIAGCRLIFRDVKSLADFRSEFHASKFNHKLRHNDDPEKYNYILYPKDSGYRGVHEIYIYEVNSVGGQKFNGLYVEIQFRTLAQHAWATAVEVVGRITENQPKFDRGDDRHKEFFRLASEIIARTAEELVSCRADLSDDDLCSRFRALDGDIGVLFLLRTLPVMDRASSIGNNVVLQLPKDGQLKIHTFSSLERATEGYFQLEKSNPDDDIVLVRAATFENIRSAYRNYFQNTRDFVDLIEAGLKRLSKAKDAA